MNLSQNRIETQMQKLTGTGGVGGVGRDKLGDWD